MAPSHPLPKAKALALAMMEEYGIKKGYLTLIPGACPRPAGEWRKLGIDPRGWTGKSPK